MAAHKVVSVPDNADLKKQALEVPGTKRPGQTGTRVIRLGPGRSQIEFFLSASSLQKWCVAFLMSALSLVMFTITSSGFWLR